MQRDTQSWSATHRHRCERIVERLSSLDGLSPTLSPDPNGSPFVRVRVDIDEHITGYSARSLRLALQQGEPAVHIRVYGGETEAFYINTTEMTDAEVTVLCNRVQALME